MIAEYLPFSVVTIKFAEVCKGELFRINWWIINLLLVSGLLEDGPG